MDILACGGTPLIKAHAVEADFPAGVPIDVVVGFEVDRLPIVAVHVAGLVDDDVAVKDKGDMVFHPRGFELGADGIDEQIVGDMVVFAVMLVESGALAVVDQVAFHRDSGRAFVGIEAPSAVFVGVDVMDAVEADFRAL